MLTTPQWQQRRGKFNHDWLKNQLSPGLAKMSNVLADEVVDSEFESSFPSRAIDEWGAHRGEVRELVKDFETEMSPLVLFADPTFALFNRPKHEWLGSLVHELWLARTGVRDLVGAAMEQIQATDSASEALRHRLAAGASPRECAREFEAFRTACGLLGKAIERFPRQIEVV